MDELAKKKVTQWYLREQSPQEFARRLNTVLQTPDVRVIWFIGAGCSVSSGIPTAGELVRRWLPQLQEIQKGTRAGWEDSADNEYPEWRVDPANYYGAVIEELFESEDDRQREIERLTGGKDPGFGYAALAQLMSHSQFGRQANVAITVNFDDLIADSLYLYTAKKPLVIGHEALTSFIRRGDETPLVIKVHGDARLAPKNTLVETSTLDEQLIQAIRRLYSRARIVILGYSGNDESIARLFEPKVGDPGPDVVYWVNASKPGLSLQQALSKIHGHVTWVKHLDFDALMSHVHSCLDLEIPDFKRLESLQGAYRSSLERLRTADGTLSADDSRSSSVDRILDRLEGSDLARRAMEVADSDPEKAEDLFQEALDTDPADVGVLGTYAVYLHNVRKEYDQAEEYYERATAADPDAAWNLGNVAIFLDRIRLDHDRAAEFYKRAIAADPYHANNLGNYASFLARAGSERAEEFYERAIAADPYHANTLGKYATFLEKAGSERAEEFYERAIAADSNHAYNLGRYAAFLKSAGRERAEEFYERAIEADPNQADSLSSYAHFLSTKGENERAAELHERAVASDPTDAIILGNYAGFLYLTDHLERGLQLEEQARKYIEPERHSDLDLELWFYAFCYDPARREEALSQLRLLLSKGNRSFGFDLSQHVQKAESSKNPDAELIEMAWNVIANDDGLDTFLENSA